MAELEIEVRKWGDSLAVIIPKHIVQQEGIRVHDNVHIKIEKETDFSDIFGLTRSKLQKTVQELKDDAKKGWD